MAEIIAKIDEVNSRQGVSQRTQKPYTVFEVKTTDGKKYSTFKAPLGQMAGALRGQAVVIQYSEQERNGYTNYTLEGIQPSQSQPVETGQQGVVVQAGPVSHNLTATASYSTSSKDESIARAVALKAAVDTVTGLQIVDANSSVVLAVADVYRAWLLGEKESAPDPFGGETNTGEPGAAEATDTDRFPF
ncbi:MAG TPA: hypothetical protein VIY48_02810 [Candidatus Paceibacterota bacterium]